MLKHAFLLTGIHLRNAFGINQARFSYDPAKRRKMILTPIAFLILGIMLCIFIAGITFGFVYLSAAEHIPLFLASAISAVIFFFTIFRAGPVLFDTRSYEMQIILPVHPVSIVISRFLRLYVFNTALSLLIILSGTVTLSVLMPVGIDYWLMMLPGAFLIPLIPMTISMFIGSLTYALTSRMRHKNIASTILSLLFVVAVVLLPMLADQSEDSYIELAESLQSLVVSFSTTYLPAAWFSAGLSGKPEFYGLFACVSVGIFGIFAIIIGKYYRGICARLMNIGTKRKYAVKSGEASSVFCALYQKELRRYFASTIYVTNTIIGYVLAVILSGAMLFTSVDAVFSEFGISADNAAGLIPFVLALISSLSPMTTSTISMEGKYWDITRSLPVSAEKLLFAKLAVNYTFSLPCAILCSSLITAALKPQGLSVLWIFLIPLALALLNGAAGLWLNLRNANFIWDSEAIPVKQASPVLYAMLLDLALSAVPLLLIFITGMSNPISLIFLLIYCALFILLLHRFRKVNLNKL